jgi:serine/threonine protein kinase
VVSIYDTGESNGYPYIAMEFVAGQNLRDLAREAPLSEEAALEVGAGIAAALGAAHQAGLIHRDVKPENMIRTPEGRTKLCDLGLARTAAESEARPLLAGPITDHGRTMGTPYFFSPEQARGKTLDIRSDLYSLGVSLFYLATGRPPFKGATPPVVLKMHLVDPPPVPSSLSPSLSPAFDALIGKLLEKDPGRRHQTPAELGEAIAALLGGEKAPAGSAAKVSPRRAPAVVRPGPARRRPAPTAAGPGRAERRRPVATPPRPRDAVGALAQWVAICACLFLVLLWVRSQLGEIEPPSTSTDRGASASVDGS